MRLEVTMKIICFNPPKPIKFLLKLFCKKKRNG